jgi:hypothetical protein
MQKRSNLILVLLAMTLISGQASAQSYGGGRAAKPIARTYGFLGTLLDLSVYYSQTEATATPATGNTWQNNTSIYDLKLGYISESQIYFGGLYSIRNDNQVSVSRVDGNSVGVGLGYFGSGGFNIRGYYKFNDTYGDYKDGTGYQAELGYAINPTSSFYLGLCFSVRETTYKTNATIAGFQSWVRKESYPFITLGFLID